MATITVTEVPEVEVTNKATSEEKESTEDISKFAKLRRRITKGSADGTNRPSGKLKIIDTCVCELLLTVLLLKEVRRPLDISPI